MFSAVILYHCFPPILCLLPLVHQPTTIAGTERPRFFPDASTHTNVQLPHIIRLYPGWSHGNSKWHCGRSRMPSEWHGALLWCTSLMSIHWMRKGSAIIWLDKCHLTSLCARNEPPWLQYNASTDGASVSGTITVLSRGREILFCNRIKMREEKTAWSIWNSWKKMTLLWWTEGFKHETCKLSASRL